MKSLIYLNEIILNKSAEIPVTLVPAIVAAAKAINVNLCGGALSGDAKFQVLYIA